MTSVELTKALYESFYIDAEIAAIIWKPSMEIDDWELIFLTSQEAKFCFSTGNYPKCVIDMGMSNGILVTWESIVKEIASSKLPSNNLPLKSLDSVPFHLYRLRSKAINPIKLFISLILIRIRFVACHVCKGLKL